MVIELDDHLVSKMIRDLSPSELRLYLFLTITGKEPDQSFRMGCPDLNKLGISRPTIRLAVDGLHKKGYIILESRKPGTGRNTWLKLVKTETLCKENRKKTV